MSLPIFQILQKVIPLHWLEKARRIKKSFRRRKLKEQERKGKIISQPDLENDFIRLGIRRGDVVLVHSSLSKIGYVKGGAATVIAALIKLIGEEGTLLMPSFPASGRNIDYLLKNSTFDVRNTPSAMGIITEVFRKMKATVRSLHPTDPVCAYGNDAAWFTDSHFGQLTPYNEHSPFRKICERKGKILMLGTTLNGACTNLHTLEDAVEFIYPVYSGKLFTVRVIDENGVEKMMQTKVHNPEWSAKRNCDALKPLFISEDVLVEGKIGEADSMLIDAAAMHAVMIHNYYENGITMYTPGGGPLPLAR